MRLVLLLFVALLLPALPAHAQEAPGRTAAASVAPVFLQAPFRTPGNLTDDCFYLHVGPGTTLSDGDLRLNDCPAANGQQGCFHCWGPPAGTPVRAGDTREKENATLTVALRLVYIDWNGNRTREEGEPLFLTTSQGPRLAPTQDPGNVTLRLQGGCCRGLVREWDHEVRGGVAVVPLDLSVTYLDNDADLAYTDEDLLLLLVGITPGLPAGSPPPLGAVEGAYGFFGVVRAAATAAPTLSAPPGSFQVLRLERGRPGDVLDDCYYLAPGSGADRLPVGAVRLAFCRGKASLAYGPPASPLTAVLSSDEDEAGAAVTSHSVFFKYADRSRNGRFDRSDPLFLSTKAEAACRGSFTADDFTLEVGPQHYGPFEGHRCAYEFSGVNWTGLPNGQLGWVDLDGTGCVSPVDGLYVLFREPLPGGGIPVQSLRLRSQGWPGGTLVTMRDAVEPASVPPRQAWGGTALCPRHVVETQTLTEVSTLTATQTVTESFTTTQPVTETVTMGPQTVTQTVTQAVAADDPVEPQGGEVAKSSPGVTVLVLAVLAACVQLVRRRL